MATYNLFRFHNSVNKCVSVVRILWGSMSARVIMWDIGASNGVVHIIDQVSDALSCKQNACNTSFYLWLGPLSGKVRGGNVSQGYNVGHPSDQRCGALIRKVTPCTGIGTLTTLTTLVSLYVYKEVLHFITVRKQTVSENI